MHLIIVFNIRGNNTFGKMGGINIHKTLRFGPWDSNGLCFDVEE